MDLSMPAPGSVNRASEFRPAEGYPGFSASTDGRIKGRSGKILRGFNDGHGYRRVSIRLDGKARQVPVHTIVCTAFHGPRPTEKHSVAHGDGDKQNNRPENLRWATMREQYEDRRRHGTDVSGAKHPRAILTASQAAEIRRRYRPYCQINGMRPLAREFGVTSGAISSIIHNGAWTERGTA